MKNKEVVSLDYELDYLTEYERGEWREEGGLGREGGNKFARKLSL